MKDQCRHLQSSKCGLYDEIVDDLSSLVDLDGTCLLMTYSSVEFIEACGFYEKKEMEL